MPTCPLLTSCCVAQFLTGQGPIPIHGPQGWGPWYRGIVSSGGVSILWGQAGMDRRDPPLPKSIHCSQEGLVGMFGSHSHPPQITCGRWGGNASPLEWRQTVGPVPQDQVKRGRDSHPKERDCWHQEQARILGKSKPIDTHCKARQCLIKGFINKQVTMRFCAKSPGLGKASTNSYCLC